VAPQSANALSSDWHEAFNSRARLLATRAPARDGKSELYAFLEIDMPKGWKTYWRNPGDAGGLPPGFEWKSSENLASATVLYPAPQRLTDEAGDTIGYKDRVIFPILIEAEDDGRAIKLALDLTYGICKDVCVPSEAQLELEVGPGDVSADHSTEELLAVLERVPRAAGERRAGDPELQRAYLEAGDGGPRLVLEVKVEADDESADVFVVAPDGLYVPMVEKGGKVQGAVRRFEAPLGNALEPKDLAGKTLSATMVSAAGSAEASFKLE
jgi:DsbC/DsbD-like thiol-disulfide interchange protein